MSTDPCLDAALDHARNNYGATARKGFIPRAYYFRLQEQGHLSSKTVIKPKHNMTTYQILLVVGIVLTAFLAGRVSTHL